jgi:hypothetical protein
MGERAARVVARIMTAVFAVTLFAAGTPGAAAEGPVAKERSGKYPAGSSVFKFGYLVRQNDDAPNPKRYLGMDVGLGFYLHPLLGFELDVGSHGVEVPMRILGSPTPLPILVLPITLSEVVQYRWDMGGVPATVYAFGGPGLYMISEKSGSDLFADKLHTGAGTQAGVGVHVWMLGVEARYISTRTTMDGHDFPVEGFIFTLNAGLH